MKKTYMLAILTALLTASAVACANPSDPVGEAGGSPGHNSGSETEVETTASPETEVETTASPETEADTAAEPETEMPTDTTVESESPSMSEDNLYFQFPLLKANDTTSFVSLPDMAGDGPKAIEFFIVPTDTETPALTSAFKFVLPRDGETNVLVLVASGPDGTPHILLMTESTYIQVLEGQETRYVSMMGTSIWLWSDKASIGLNDYSRMHGGGSAAIRYTEEVKKTVLLANRNNNNHALKSVEKLLDKYSNNDSFTYKFTILYSYINGVETINTPVDSIPEFTYELFKQYGFSD